MLEVKNTSFIIIVKKTASVDELSSRMCAAEELMG